LTLADAIRARDVELVAMGEPARRRLHDAAERRLNDALSHALVGNRDAARSRVEEMGAMLGDAVGTLRARAFDSSYMWWAARHDPDAIRPGLPADPPRGWTALARGMALHGMTPAQSAGAIAEGLRHHLDAATASKNPDAMVSWRFRAGEAFRRAIDSAVSDATMIADQAAGRWTARPDLLEPHPHIPDPPRFDGI
jgi:hypothetical protein